MIPGRSFDREPGGWWINLEPELHLANCDILVPDLAGRRQERMPELPQTAWFEIVPDRVCEVLSPSAIKRGRGPQREIRSP